MKIQLKRSNVLVDQKAKEPTADQMEFGELAVNYNEQDPAIFIKDNANNIIRISGREVPMGPTPPPNPLPGNFWFNPEDGRLYIWYKDVDSEQWVDASPDDWRPEILPELDGPASQPGTLDDRYVNVVGDNMIGNLTLGTDQITLNTDGSASFANNKVSIYVNGVTYFGDVNAAFAAASGTNGFSCANSNGDITFNATTNGVVRIGGDIDLNQANITLSDDGSATFADNVVGGRFEIAGEGINSRYVNAPNWIVFSDGGHAIGGTLPSDPNISLNSDGSAVFAGLAHFGEAAGVLINGGPYDYQGKIDVCRDGATNPVWQGWVKGSNEPTSQILANGSATFDGEVVVGTRDAQGCFMTPAAAAEGWSGGVKQWSFSVNGGYVKGNITSDGTIGFNLEADDDTKYTATTDADGIVTRVYNGATLDVKDRLQKADAALLALKTAALAATDFASLQSAIVTALADI